MLDEKSRGNEFSCPIQDRPSGGQAQPGIELTPDERAVLSRFGRREWVADAQIDRLQAQGLVERVFGQAVLTRLGRATLGITG